MRALVARLNHQIVARTSAVGRVALHKRPASMTRLAIAFLVAAPFSRTGLNAGSLILLASHLDARGADLMSGDLDRSEV